MKIFEKLFLFSHRVLERATLGSPTSDRPKLRYLMFLSPYTVQPPYHETSAVCGYQNQGIFNDFHETLSWDK